VDKDLERFQADLLRSVREIKAGKAARITEVAVSPVTAVRNAAGLSQTQFAALLGVSLRTLQGWEQGRREPTGAAKTLCGSPSAIQRYFARWPRRDRRARIRPAAPTSQTGRSRNPGATPRSNAGLPPGGPHRLPVSLYVIEPAGELDAEGSCHARALSSGMLDCKT